jgi:hypothetical protein
MKTRRDERGLGLVELLVGLAITGSILSVLGLTLVAILKDSATGRTQQSATHQLRDGLFWLNQDTQSGVASQATVAAGDVTMQWTDYSTGSIYSSHYQQVGSELQRTFTVNCAPATRTVARNVVAGGFTASRSGNAVTYALTVQNGAGTQSRTETAMMRVADLRDSGYLNPSAQAADTGGDGNGFEVRPTSAYADAGGFASNIQGHGDRHRYYNYGVSVPGGCGIAGVVVRLDYWLKNTGGTNSVDVELSWNGGTSWTTAKSDSSEPTSETTVLFGSSSDTWGHAWSAGDLTNGNFRVRVTSNVANAAEEMYLDWIPVRVYWN